jgi:hypothetical protein
MRPFVTVPGSITSISPNCDGSALIVGTAQGAVLRYVKGGQGSVAVGAVMLEPIMVPTGTQDR